MLRSRVQRWAPCALAVVLIAAAAAPVRADPVPLPPILPGGGPSGSPAPRPQPGPPAPVTRAPGSVSLGVNASHTGFLADEALVPPLRRRWSVRQGGAVSQILAAAGEVVTLSGTGVTARSQATGRLLWRRRAGAAGGGIDGGSLYLAEGDDVVAVDLRTGAQRWRHFTTSVAFLETPVADRGVVYAGWQQGGGTMQALGASDGRVLWSVSEPGGERAPTLDGGRLYGTGACAVAHALERASGRRVWLRTTGCSGGGSVWGAVHRGRLWIPEMEYLEAPPVLTATDGRLVRRFPGMGHPVFVDGRVVVPTEERTTSYAEDTFARRWRSGPLAGLTAVGHDLYGFRGGRLRVLDAQTGAFLWSAPARQGFAEAEPVLGVAPGLLFVANRGGLTAYESELRPTANGVAVEPDRGGVYAGGGFKVIGVIGSARRAARPRVTIEIAARGRRFGRAGSARPLRDGGFVAPFTLYRNVAVRARLGSARSRAVRVYAYPRVSFGPARHAPRGRVRVRVEVRTPRTRLAGRRFVLYAFRARGQRNTRLATGRLRAVRPGVTRTTLIFVPPRRGGRRDGLSFCVRGQLRLGLGRPDRFTRRCGRRRITG